MDSKTLTKDDDEDDVDDPNYNPEEEVTGDFAGTITLPEVPKVTGEEQEENTVKIVAKLYRWKDNQWKERGVGDLKFMKHKVSNKIRILMRSDKTLKLIANFYVQGKKPLCQLKVNNTTDRAWTWSCCDFSQDNAVIEKQCARFKTKEDFELFKKEFEAAFQSNNALGSDKTPETTATTTESAPAPQKEEEAKKQ